MQWNSDTAKFKDAGPGVESKGLLLVHSRDVTHGCLVECAVWTMPVVAMQGAARPPRAALGRIDVRLRRPALAAWPTRRSASPLVLSVYGWVMRWRMPRGGNALPVWGAAQQADRPGRGHHRQQVNEAAEPVAEVIGATGGGGALQARCRWRTAAHRHQGRVNGVGHRITGNRTKKHNRSIGWDRPACGRSALLA